MPADAVVTTVIVALSSFATLLINKGFADRAAKRADQAQGRPWLEAQVIDLMEKYKLLLSREAACQGEVRALRARDEERKRQIETLRQEIAVIRAQQPPQPPPAR